MKPVSCILVYLIVFSFFPADSALCATEPDTAVSATLRVAWGLLVVLGILFIIYGLMKKRCRFCIRPEKA